VDVISTVHVRVPKGTVVTINGMPLRLLEDAFMESAAPLSMNVGTKAPKGAGKES
jgi:hypothetical protein